MEYPGSYFTRPWRIILLIFFIGFFLTLTPIILLYSVGYSYDWQNGLLKKTGGLSIDILPADTSVSLDGVKLNEKMPIRLKNITSRKYDLSLSSPNYYSWQKEIEVKDKETIYIKEISLLKQNSPEKISSDLPEILSLSPNGNYLAYAIKKTDTDNDNKNTYLIFILENSTGNNQLIELPTIGNLPQMQWSGDEKYLAIAPDSTTNDNIFIISTADKKLTWQIITSDKSAVTKFAWQDSPGQQIFFSTKKEIFIANPTNARVTSVSKNDFLDWQTENNQIWTIQLSSTTDKYVITKDTFGFATEFATFNVDKEIDKQIILPEILAAHAGQILLQIRPGDVLIVNQNEQYPIKADHWRLAPYNDWWLFWTSYEINTYTSGQPPYLLTRSGEGLRDVWPLDHYNTLGLVWNKRVEALFPYYSVSHNLLDYPVENSTADSFHKILYFSGTLKDERGLWKLPY